MSEKPTAISDQVKSTLQAIGALNFRHSAFSYPSGKTPYSNLPPQKWHVEDSEKMKRLVGIKNGHFTQESTKLRPLVRLKRNAPPVSFEPEQLSVEKQLSFFDVPPEKYVDLEFLKTARALLPPGLDVYFYHDQKNTCICGDDLTPYQILRYLKVWGGDQGIYSDEIVEQLIRWNLLWGVDLLVAGSRYCMIRLNKSPTEFESFAGELWQLCPSVFERGGPMENYGKKEVKTAIAKFKKSLAADRIIGLYWP